MHEMSEGELYIQRLKLLLDAYMQVIRLKAEPGERAYCVNTAADFLRKQIKDLLK